jgi:Bacterial protein of unknown function (DUF899)
MRIRVSVTCSIKYFSSSIAVAPAHWRSSSTSTSGVWSAALRNADTTTGRGNEPVMGAFSLLDMTPYGRREAWHDNPERWPEGTARAGTGARTQTGTPPWGPTSRPVPQWTRPGATPVQTLGRDGRHH